jgi:hypothetical protein
MLVVTVHQYRAVAGLLLCVDVEEYFAFSAIQPAATPAGAPQGPPSYEQQATRNPRQTSMSSFNTAAAFMRGYSWVAAALWACWLE